MSDRILIFYGSYRSDRQGIRLADYLVRAFAGRGAVVELIDAKAVDLPMLDRMYKEYPEGTAPEALATLARKIRAADAFVFVTGEYNWGVQPGLKNLTDHFLEEWFWRPAAILSYSAQRAGGARANYAWHAALSEMGMVVISSITIDNVAPCRRDRSISVSSVLMIKAWLNKSVRPSVSALCCRSWLTARSCSRASLSCCVIELKAVENSPMKSMRCEKSP